MIPVKEIDYILTLRAWEYCAVLTKWESLKELIKDFLNKEVKILG